MAGGGGPATCRGEERGVGPRRAGGRDGAASSMNLGARIGAHSQSCTSVTPPPPARRSPCAWSPAAGPRGARRSGRQWRRRPLGGAGATASERAVKWKPRSNPLGSAPRHTSRHRVTQGHTFPGGHTWKLATRRPPGTSCTSTCEGGALTHRQRRQSRAPQASTKSRASKAQAWRCARPLGQPRELSHCPPAVVLAERRARASAGPGPCLAVVVAGRNQAAVGGGGDPEVEGKGGTRRTSPSLLASQPACCGSIGSHATVAVPQSSIDCAAHQLISVACDVMVVSLARVAKSHT